MVSEGGTRRSPSGVRCPRNEGSNWQLMTLGTGLVEAPWQRPMERCSSVPARSRCAAALVVLELAAQLGPPARPRFGLGSVSEGGSVSTSNAPSRSWAFPHRTVLSELLRIRVSMVRFRPWPSMDKWPKWRTLGQNKGHLFRLRRGIGPFSVHLPHHFVPARNSGLGVGLTLLHGRSGLRRRFLCVAPNAVRQFPLQDRLQRKA